MNRKCTFFLLFFLLMIASVHAQEMIVPISPQPTPIPRPSSWINPYAYEMPHFDQGTTGTCTGATGAYALGIIRKMVEGNQPTYIEPTVTRGLTTSYEGHSITYDALPSWYLSARSIFAAYDFNSSHKNNISELAETLMIGANLESDWITPRNTASTTYYTPQPLSYLSTHRIWQTHGFTSFDGNEATPSELHTAAQKWELLKEGVYRNGVGGIVIPTYTNYSQVNVTAFGNQWAEPLGAARNGEWHVLAVVGYDDTRNVIYVMNSWAESHTAHEKIEALTYDYWKYASDDTNGRPNATIFRW